MIDEESKARICIAISVVAFVAAFISALTIGRFHLSLEDVLGYLTGSIDTSSNKYKVIHDLRLPRTIVAALVGVALSLSGVLYQETFQNKLISPDFLGVTSGASVGAALAILCGLSAYLVSATAFVAGIVTVALTLSLSKAFQGRSPTILLLSGIIIGGLMGSLLSIIKYLADPESTLATITFWLMGSCESSTMEDVAILLPVVGVCTAVLLLIRWRINLVALGREEAQTKGLNYALYRNGIIAMATAMTASAVSIVGSVGWVGLVIPHMVRISVGRNMARTIPLAISFGATFMVIVDVLSRSFTDSEIPLSAITGLFGTVIFVAIIILRRRTIIESDRNS